MKTCTKCGETKDATGFHKAKFGLGGLKSQCKACAADAQAKQRAPNKDKLNAASRAWRAANPEKHRAASAAWDANNADRRKATNAAWRAANKDRDKATTAAWRAANAEKVKATSAAWCAANREKRKANGDAWAAANREKRSASATAWAKANPDSKRLINQNRRARKSANGGRLSPGLVAKLFKLQRGKCACCHVSIADGNHLDHRIPVALGGPNEDWNMQLLCAPCNLSKGAKHPVDFMQQRGMLL